MADMLWQVIECDGVMHIVPLGDIEPHLCWLDCWCRPTDDEGIIVHHSQDRREEREVH